MVNHGSDAFSEATWELVQWHVDPGHSWLRVPHELLSDRELRVSISWASYMDSEFAYLEEDEDAGRFLEFYGFEQSHFNEVRGDYADGHVDRGFVNPRDLNVFQADRVARSIGKVATSGK